MTPRDTATAVSLDYEPTGEHRSPRAGEWFRGSSGGPVRAQFDFRVQAFDILREVVTRTATAVSLDLDAIRAREKRAHDEVARLCTHRGARWRMQIPANPDRDSDLVIASALADVPALVAEVERLRAERDRTVEYCRDIEAASRLGPSAFTKGARMVAVAAMKSLGVDPLAVTT